MTVARLLSQGQLLALAALLTAVAGVLSAWAGVLTARHKAEQKCEARVKELRAENEALAAELHQLRLGREI